MSDQKNPPTFWVVIVADQKIQPTFRVVIGRIRKLRRLRGMISPRPWGCWAAAGETSHSSCGHEGGGKGSREWGEMEERSKRTMLEEVMVSMWKSKPFLL